MTRRRRTIPTARRAFTLLELVVVMVILCVLMMAVAPSLNTFGSARQTEQTASTIISLAQWARDQAISDGRSYRLYFNPSAQTYQVRVQQGATYVETGNEFGRQFQLPENLRLTVTSPQEGGMNYVEFRPTGRTDPVSVRIEDNAGRVTELACATPAEPLRAIEPEQR